MPTMSDCIADVNRCVRQIRTLSEKRTKTTRAALRDGIDGDLTYWTTELTRCIEQLTTKLGEQYDWMGRNPSSPALDEIWRAWNEGREVYEDTCDYYERLPKQAALEGTA